MGKLLWRLHRAFAGSNVREQIRRTCSRTNERLLEDGHANLGDALKRIRYYQQDTEPPEWPQLVEDANFNIVVPQRLSAMRIGEIATVSKVSSCAAQAGDMLAYLVGYVFSGHRTRAFEGVFDHLLSLQPVVSTGYGPSSVTELAEALREVERTRKGKREPLCNEGGAS